MMKTHDHFELGGIEKAEICFNTAVTLQVILHHRHCYSCKGGDMKKVKQIVLLAKTIGKKVLTSPSTFIYTVGTTLTKY